MANAKTLEYKGYPLRRKGNIIYYGNMSDKYIKIGRASCRERV